MAQVGTGACYMSQISECVPQGQQCCGAAVSLPVAETRNFACFVYKSGSTSLSIACNIKVKLIFLNLCTQNFHRCLKKLMFIS
jgi:hypothetical protein